ncbi:MAG: WD40 repeat domain-containing protein [bacterium]|nr:WD40 repeat domain-containing protein [bacterium]
MRRLFWIVLIVALFLTPVASLSAQTTTCPPQLLESANRLIVQARDALALGQYETADALLAAAQELLVPCYGGATFSPTAPATPTRIEPTPIPSATVEFNPTPVITNPLNLPIAETPLNEITTVQLSFGEFADDIRGVDFSPNGFYALASSFDSYLYLFDIETGEQVRQFSGHTDWVFNADFTRDGTLLASASADDTIRIWDVASATTLEVLSGHTENVTNVAFSPDASILVSTGQDNRILVWDTSTWSIIADLRGHTDWVWDVAFSPDGSFFATISSDTNGIVWNAQTFEEVGRLVGHTSVAISIEYSHDGLNILTGSHDGTAILWDAATFQPIRYYRGGNGESGTAVMDVAFSPDDNLVAMASFSGFVHIWEKNGTPLASYTGHTSSGVWAVQFSPDGQFFLSGADDGGMLLNRVRG